MVHATVIALIGWIYVPDTNAQPSTPPPETAPPTSPETFPATPPAPALTQAPSYIGFGGTIGLQGSTTSLSQGTFSILTKRVLTENLAIHNSNTIFGSIYVLVKTDKTIPRIAIFF